MKTSNFANKRNGYRPPLPLNSSLQLCFHLICTNYLALTTKTGLQKIWFENMESDLITI